MISFEVKLDKRSSDKLRRKMEQVSKAVSTTRGGGPAAGMERVNRKVSIWLDRWVDKNIATEGGKVGGWKPFTYGGRLVRKGYLGRKRKGSGATPIRLPMGSGKTRQGYINENAKLLQDTGLLKQKVHPFHTRRSAGVGNNIPYSLAHEEGMPERGVPQRRILPESGDRDVEIGVLKIYDTYIERVVRK